MTGVLRGQRGVIGELMMRERHIMDVAFCLGVPGAFVRTGWSMRYRFGTSVRYAGMFLCSFWRMSACFMTSFVQNIRWKIDVFAGDGEERLAVDAEFVRKQLVPAMTSLGQALRLTGYRRLHWRRSFCIRVFFLSAPMQLRACSFFSGERFAGLAIHSRTCGMLI